MSAPIPGVTGRGRHHRDSTCSPPPNWPLLSIPATSLSATPRLRVWRWTSPGERG